MLDGGKMAFLVLERHVAFSICLIGGTGVGKSSTCNVLCGDKEMDENGYLANVKDEAHFTFKESAGSKSETSSTAPRMVRWLGTDVQVLVIDTPGLSDSRGAEHDEQQIGNLVENLRRVHGVSMFLIVLDVQKVRWTNEQTEVMKVFDAVFSTKNSSFLDNTAFLFNKCEPRYFNKKLPDAMAQARAAKAGELVENIKDIFNPAQISFL